MSEKITSIRIKEELWKAAKILAIEEGVPLKSLIEEALSILVEGNRIAKNFEYVIRDDALKELKALRKKGKLPFQIISEKTAVEIVREGRGD